MEGKGEMSDRYSMDRHDKKIGGVCATLGDVFNIDPTIPLSELHEDRRAYG